MRRRRVEFWPDYGGLLLHERGTPVPIGTLGLPAELVAQTEAWLERYSDDRLDPPTAGQAWIDQGRDLFRRLRGALAPAGVEVFDWEGRWSTPDE